MSATHDCVSRQERCTGTPVCYLHDQSSSWFQPIITQNYCAYFYQIYIFKCLHIQNLTYHIWNKQPQQFLRYVRVPEIHRIFFIFFFFAPHNKYVCKLCSCTPISMAFGAQGALLNLHLHKVWYDLQQLSIIILTNLLTCLLEKLLVLLLWNLLSGTNLTLTVEYFDGFVNWHSIADFMITETSRCNFWQTKIFKRGAYLYVST